MENKGFTLIELLVVIAVIGLLVSIVLVSLNSAKTKARDARRKEDLKQIQTALYLYYEDYGSFPTTSSPPWNESCSPSWQNLAAQLSPYISSLPIDPSNSSCLHENSWVSNTIYTYVYGSLGGTTYDLFVTRLENQNDPDRCANRCWQYHLSGDTKSFCAQCPPAQFSKPDLYADH